MPCHVTSDKPTAEVGPCAHPAQGSPQVPERSPSPHWQGHCTMLGFGRFLMFSGFYHSSPQGHLYTFALHGDTKCPHTCRQWIPFYFRRTSLTSGPVLALGPEDPHRAWQIPHNRPTKTIQPRAAPRWENTCEDTKLFCATQKCDPWCREGSCGHTGSPLRPMPASPPPWQGGCWGPACRPLLVWGHLGTPAPSCPHDLQSWGSE